MHEVDAISRLVNTALKQERLSGLSQVLKEIAEAVNAQACILWEVIPNTNLNKQLISGRLFVLAEWFKYGKPFIQHDMPLIGSANGWAILNNESVNIISIEDDERTYKHNPAIVGAGLRYMCAVPISFSDSGIPNAAVSVYRTDKPPFSNTELALVERMSAPVPSLYRAIQNRMSRSLIYEINELLNKTELKELNQSQLRFENVRKGLQRIAVKVSESFQCIETSIFLGTRTSLGVEIELVASTWPEWSLYKKPVYKADKEEGITGWVLATNKAVKIHDLANFEKEKSRLRREYPGIIWKDSLDIRRSAREILSLRSLAELPPLGFMAAPISRGNKVYGVIRCCTARQWPYFFESRELKLLKFVATQISRFWSNWLIRREKVEDDIYWGALVKGISQLNSFVQREFETSPDESRIFDEALRVTKDVITGSDILDVRLLDKESNELYFANTDGGDAWKKGSSADIQERLKKRFSISESMASDGSLAVKVFQEKKAQIINDASLEGYQSKTFPETKSIIVAPIGVKKELIGVLDIRNTGGKPFPRHSLRIAELLGQQLGLYRHLAEVIAMLRDTESELKRQEQIRQRVFEDLSHQLKGPVSQVTIRSNMLLQGTLPADLEHRIKILRGLSRKAQRVTMTTGFFKELARYGEVGLNKKQLTRLTPEDARIRLIEAASDNELAIEQYRQIAFAVNREGFDFLARNIVLIDIDLFEQAVNCLLDNAGKYSYPNTKVEISGGLPRKEPGFYIEVKNKGFPIRADEVEKCKQREWRGVYAKHSTGEGSGIGLWAVDQIMKAHKGALIIHASTNEQITQVRLVFPLSM